MGLFRSVERIYLKFTCTSQYCFNVIDFYEIDYLLAVLRFDVSGQESDDVKTIKYIL